MEADVVGDFGDARGGAKEHAFGFFDPGAVDEVGEGEAGGALEELAEVEWTDVYRGRHGFEAHLLAEVTMDEVFGVANGFGFVGGVGEEEAVGGLAELEREGGEDGDGGLIADGVHDGDVLEVDFGTADLGGGVVAVEEGFGDRGEMVGGGGLEANAAGAKGGEMRFANLNRDEGFDDSGDACGGLRFRELGAFGNDFEAEGQAGQGVEGVVIVLEELAICEILDESTATGGLGTGVVGGRGGDGIEFDIHGALWFEVVGHRATLG